VGPKVTSFIKCVQGGWWPGKAGRHLGNFFLCFYGWVGPKVSSILYVVSITFYAKK